MSANTEQRRLAAIMLTDMVGYSALAQRHEPNLADAHLSLGIALASAFDWNGGKQEIKHALELNPKLSLAYDQLACVEVMFGQFDNAIKNQQKAIDLDPLSRCSTRTWVGSFLRHAETMKRWCKLARRWSWIPVSQVLTMCWAVAPHGKAIR